MINLEMKEDIELLNKKSLELLEKGYLVINNKTYDIKENYLQIVDYFMYNFFRLEQIKEIVRYDNILQEMNKKENLNRQEVVYKFQLHNLVNIYIQNYIGLTESVDREVANSLTKLVNTVEEELKDSITYTTFQSKRKNRTSNIKKEYAEKVVSENMNKIRELFLTPTINKQTNHKKDN